MRKVSNSTKQHERERVDKPILYVSEGQGHQAVLKLWYN